MIYSKFLVEFFWVNQNMIGILKLVFMVKSNSNNMSAVIVENIVKKYPQKVSFGVWSDIYRCSEDVMTSIHNQKLNFIKMTSTKKIQVVKMNLTLSREFYQLLQANAKNDYSKTATWTKQFLMKSFQTA